MSRNPQETTAFCTERSRLLYLYSAAVKKLTEISGALSASAISYDARVFNRESTTCQQVWRECSHLRHALLRHMVEHGC